MENAKISLLNIDTNIKNKESESKTSKSFLLFFYCSFFT